MLALSKHHDLRALDERLRDAPEVTAELVSDILAEIRRPLSAERIERLVRSEAWTDAALELIDLELPQWQVRRIAYDGGEWHCALSRQRELPEWLDLPIEARHADLPLALLSAFVDARFSPAPSNRTSVPLVPRETSPLYEPMLTDNYA